MGRKNRYESNVKPFLDQIPKWYETMTEGQIARKLGVSPGSFENYKAKYPELVKCLRTGKEILIDDLKDSLKKKARGFSYTETKRTYIEDKHGNRTGAVKIEETEKYSAPDTGAIHLLLKNLCEDWHNDDSSTIKMQREKLDIEKQKLVGGVSDQVDNCIDDALTTALREEAAKIDVDPVDLEDKDAAE